MHHTNAEGNMRHMFALIRAVVLLAALSGVCLFASTIQQTSSDPRVYAGNARITNDSLNPLLARDVQVKVGIPCTLLGCIGEAITSADFGLQFQDGSSLHSSHNGLDADPFGVDIP